MGREDFKVNPVRLTHRLCGLEYTELQVSSEHGMAVADLPPLHRDPFDRLLLAPTHVEGATLVTTNKMLHAYPVATLSA